ncbi:MAG TPA: hypothetical protein VJM33_15630, partial [Microthrixaceae bacterium]|nr:hypothetical protein [Microthrixaceae bacterium]
MCASSLGNFTNTVRAADRTGPGNPVAVATALQAQGVLYLCGLNAFYVPPTDLSGTTPGQVLRAAPVYPSPAGPSTTAFRVMYRSTLRGGGPVAATGLVVLPKTEPATNSR